MSYNISGLAINKNYQDDFKTLQKELGWSLKQKEEIDFKTASSNWKEDGICDVYFTEKGTLLFMSMENCTEYFGLKMANILTFAVSETTKAFNINYTEKGVETRAIMEVHGDRLTDHGKKLPFEENLETSDIIWKQLGILLGKGYTDISHDEKAIRYKFDKPIKSNVKKAKKGTLLKPNFSPSSSKSSLRTMWQLW